MGGISLKVGRYSLHWQRERQLRSPAHHSLLADRRCNVSRALRLLHQEYPVMMDRNLELSAKAIPPSLNLLAFAVALDQSNKTNN